MDDKQRLSPEERQDLVAFLDGEADPELSQRLERKIATSVSARREADLLKRTWELLDFLGTPAVSSDFTARTVKMLALEDQRKEAVGQSAVQVGRQALWGLVCVAAVAGCFVAALFAAELWPDKSRRLVEDLPVLEHYEEYRALGDLDYLKHLHNANYLDEIDVFIDARPDSNIETAKSP